MSGWWHKGFLTFGFAITVFGMRLLFPRLVAGITAKLIAAVTVRGALDIASVTTAARS